MNKKMKIAIICIILALISFCVYKGKTYYFDTNVSRVYELTGIIDKIAVNTYPQSIIVTDEDICTIVHNGSFKDIDDIPFTENNTDIYLMPSEYIQSDEQTFDEIPNKLFDTK